MVATTFSQATQCHLLALRTYVTSHPCRGTCMTYVAMPYKDRRGGRAIKRYRRRHPLMGTDGVVSPEMTTPSALSKVASRYFLDAQPPLLFQEGNTVCQPSI